ncbi:DNA glycosylase [Phakopsora pachyrhizi]|uniref:Endonuclease III homolog n=1 Tax=Phakopsora pachyrhizi TaxID=170000 RepID=A0AAV0B2E8_PHAPC|nr:DNA glycosylase [Phakopsora pachyrhizi]CAH7674997.1 DNA glycosylase [Phakopsora pachyrhizi]
MLSKILKQPLNSTSTRPLRSNQARVNEPRVTIYCPRDEGLEEALINSEKDEKLGKTHSNSQSSSSPLKRNVSSPSLKTFQPTERNIRNKPGLSSNIPKRDEVINATLRLSRRVKSAPDKIFGEGNLTESKFFLPTSKKPDQSIEKAQRQGRSPKKLRLSLDEPHPAPPRWKETYELIHLQRSKIVAPVDTMGCEKAGNDDHEGLDQSIKLPARSEVERRLSCLVSLMLSSQTKDEITSQAVLNLRRNLTNGLTVNSLREAPLDKIQACINKVGFWRRKSEYIKEMAETLYQKHNCDVPKTLDDLVALKGVGPKMAFLALSSAWSINEGIGVDTHVHRITNRLGWHKPETKDPEKTRLNLQSWLPKNLHQEINYMLVGFGQMICLPVGPRCDECAVGSVEGLCPSKKTRVTKKRRIKDEESTSGRTLKRSTSSSYSTSSFFNSETSIGVKRSEDSCEMKFEEGKEVKTKIEKDDDCLADGDICNQQEVQSSPLSSINSDEDNCPSKIRKIGHRTDDGGNGEQEKFVMERSCMIKNDRNLEW